VKAEDASDNNNNSEHQEGAGDNDKSILGSLSPLSDDVLTTASYEAFCKALEDAEDAGGESSPPKQIFATVTGGEDDEDDDPKKTPTGDVIPALAQPEALPRVRTCDKPELSHGQSLKFYEGMTNDELVEAAGVEGEHFQHPEILTTPITPDAVVDLEALEATRKELLKSSKNIVKVTASVFQDKMDTERIVEQARENNRQTKEALLNGKKLGEEWRAKVNETHEETQRMRREAIHPRNINFDSATHPKLLATPKDNMKMAAELLAKSNKEIDIEHLSTVVAMAMHQQSKADT
jgi:hypothetical protein